MVAKDLLDTFKKMDFNTTEEDTGVVSNYNSKVLLIDAL
jgi:hypothetical protein